LSTLWRIYWKTRGPDWIRNTKTPLSFASSHIWEEHIKFFPPPSSLPFPTTSWTRRRGLHSIRLTGILNQESKTQVELTQMPTGWQGFHHLPRTVFPLLGEQNMNRGVLPTFSFVTQPLAFILSVKKHKSLQYENVF